MRRRREEQEQGDARGLSRGEAHVSSSSYDTCILLLI
jgi:hypothetical protein